jgi:hypothetical protein
MPALAPAHHAFPTTRPHVGQGVMLAHTPAHTARPAFGA